MSPAIKNPDKPREYWVDLHDLNATLHDPQDPNAVHVIEYSAYERMDKLAGSFSVKAMELEKERDEAFLVISQFCDAVMSNGDSRGMKLLNVKRTANKLLTVFGFKK